MNPSTKSKFTKGTSPLPSREEKYGLDPTLLFAEPAKDDADKETISIKMRIDDTISKVDKTNYETKSFKVTETFGYNGVAVLKTLRTLNLYIFMSYSPKGRFSLIRASDYS